ncbi:hypothetical protein ACI6PS_02560 [Flavobacterium sp. PLA-1-15]|uniref:hypothetical protein n=1 Tax=Flavobacterium sp. PLA-1-15 TaxID=3380533 RepID=UPI003B828454
MTLTYSKGNAYKLSDQVKTLLHEKGLSAVFNYEDFKYFKGKAKTAFNKAQAITELFIEENINVNSDFDEYVF